MLVVKGDLLPSMTFSRYDVAQKVLGGLNVVELEGNHLKVGEYKSMLFLSIVHRFRNSIHSPALTGLFSSQPGQSTVGMPQHLGR